MKAHGAMRNKTIGVAIAFTAASLTLGEFNKAHAQNQSQRAGTTYPFAGGMNSDGSLKPSPPLTRLFADDYYTEYSLLDPSTGEYRITRRTEESPVGSSVFDWIRFEGELVPHFGAGEASDLEFCDPRSGKPLKYIFGKPDDSYSVRVTLPSSGR
jgi:hypothetical protein